VLVGISLVQNGVSLGYPFVPCLENLLGVCDRVDVNAGIDNSDSTMEVLEDLGSKYSGRLAIVRSRWDTSHETMGNDLSHRTNQCLKIAVGEGAKALVYCQADEVVSSKELTELFSVVDPYSNNICLERTYFWKDLYHSNRTWAHDLVRVCPITDSVCVLGDGMYMQFDGLFNTVYVPPSIARIYHYSRVGDSRKIAEKLNRLDSMFHDPEMFDFLEDYEFGTNNNFETDADLADVLEIDVEHPSGIAEFYRGN